MTYMCGIVGYIGKNRAMPILLDGLTSLEYRGYDSAGVAVIGDNGLATRIRSVGKVASLRNKLYGASFDARLGIAHTRWATHGGVTEENAHPHVSCDGYVHLAHNGIIENYKELKSSLLTRSHVFKSETDTEVIAHLIEEERNAGHGLEEAVRRALKAIRGTYGIAVCDAREPAMLIAARNFSPLLLGVGEDEYIIASDASAVLKRTNKVMYLENGEVVVVRSGSYKISSLEHDIPIKRIASELEEVDVLRAGIGKYPNFMLKEICEQPEAIENSMRGRLIIEQGEAMLGGLRDAEEKLRRSRRIIVCACGSAYLAGKVGEYFLEEYAGIPVEVDFASEFRYRKPIFEPSDILLAISQSGETADTLAVLYEAKKKGIFTLGIVNAVGSSIARETDAGIYQHIGPEISVAATKSFVSQVTILALLSLFLGRKRNMSLVMGKKIAEALYAIPQLMKTVIERRQEVEHLAKKYSSYKNFFFLGRKYNFPVAQEGALKIKEIAYVHAEGYGAGELKHGPLALVDEQFPTIAIVTKDSVYEKSVSNIQEIIARKGPVIAIATEGDREIKEIADDVFYIPKTLEMLTPILSVIPLQLFAYYSGIHRGHDVDKPRNLAKSVTVE